MHKIFIIFLFLCSITSYSQKITIKGKVTDSNDLPLESATVYLTTVKDSSVMEYTITGKTGLWELKTRKSTNPIFLKISYLGLANHKQEIQVIEEDRDFGTIKLKENPTELNEIVIQREVPPIRIKKDTLEFNAHSFKVRPNANVETLLKQLPSVSISSEGKIIINGKTVDQILVNGMPFFDSSGEIALKNLPAEIIDKIQVSDSKTKKEELSGKPASGDNSSINLTIKKDRNKGLFGKIMGGYGNDERYDGGTMLNFFNGKMKLSFLASSNNINSNGFSLNDAYSMARGLSFSGGGGSSGITRSDMAGLNYTDEWFKDFNTNTSYNYTTSSTENTNRTSLINYLPESEDLDNPGIKMDKSYTTNSTSRSDRNRSSHAFRNSFQYKIDKTSTIYFAPKFTQSNSVSYNTSSSSSERLTDNKLMNESNSSRHNESDNISFGSHLTYNKQLTSRKGRGISLTFNNENTRGNGKALNMSNTTRYKYPNGTVNKEIDIRDQVSYSKDDNESYKLDFEYTEPITSSMDISIGIDYNFNKSTDSEESYNYDAVTNSYITYNDSLSNYSESRTQAFSPKTGINFKIGNFRFNTTTSTKITSFKNNALFISREYDFNRTYMLPSTNMMMSYSLKNSNHLSLSYSYMASLPGARQVLPIENITNPLNTITGNPDLDPRKSHRLRVSFRSYDMAARSGYSFTTSSNFHNSEIAQYSIIDDSGKKYTTYRNISGSMSTNVMANWNKSIEKGVHKYRFNFDVSTSYSVDKGYNNAELYNSRSITLSQNSSLTYQYGEFLTINPTYNFNYNRYSYSNYSISSSSNFSHRFNMETTSYWPKNIIMENDFSYTYNSNVGSGFKKDFYLLNISLGYNFIDNRLLFKTKVYDLLNQNLGTTRTINPTDVRTEENTVLKRYIMFSLTYKLEQFGGKKNKKE